MFRAALRPYLALLLLLCLGRTLLPEAWMLAWHPHAHTTQEPAYARQPTAGLRQLLFTTQHQHCHAEQFYNVPFALGSILVLPQPRRCPHYPAWRGARQLGHPRLVAPAATSRGPPWGISHLSLGSAWA
ncbi:MAG: hypothetical protein ACRYFK_13595 [Janthinobacterium lividum]